MKIHFIGIGGIGVSALAQYYLEKGHEVTGFDFASSEITDYLKKKGVSFKKDIPNDTNLIIHTSAISPSDSKLTDAMSRGIEIMSYPEALGELTKQYFTVAVSGTHGKSTTTSMVALIMINAGLDPSVIIGTKLKEFGNTNFRAGNSKYLVIEADEWNRSFLNYWPRIIVLTSIEKEHMDTYKDMEDIMDTYGKYIEHLSLEGVLVANGDDLNIANLKIGEQVKIQKYSLNQEDAAKVRSILKVPGEHNVSNALAALSVSRQLGIPDEKAFEALSSFKGSWRRFQEKRLKLGIKNLTLVSDYGHHPTEIKATLDAALQKFPKKKIWCVFQPHQHQRTHYLFNDFVKVFSSSGIDRVIITDIYDVAGREKKEIKRKVSSRKLVKSIGKENVIYLKKENIISYLKKNIAGKEILILMGAGDIYTLL
ncbi:MAG: UDP-N-acetylmuramate--L-alanine ligase [Candidatus Nealsonbacteria bacterium RIFOXYB1_FULL_40_15]|uniref:UDP-N-acetylmuramate--L-alanine ligase n=1 Tax=Candidatus Nealsonbacteria bacterium RIFOXYB1_FULL_40_15 TaxID=1801677 RepID=A0A1G2EP95_9BACT|nr:MAG: UDP-N-acetylmuramate--L-alanine ligase [Candidatus Nealsonbacteria bacterium RIFOXYB1_FULL_40_15]OGZ29101.1 MAG: UDP-N-acetylmuramate--L-alanine ligase [Candidatus Nealsonbacteria bacterium RIFOXYD1_FULL_39_11]